MAAGREGMEMTFEYEVEKVLEILKKNREIHKADYEEAMVEYKRIRLERLAEIKKQLLENCDKVQKKMEDGDLKVSFYDLQDDVDFNLVEPKSYLDTYDDFIEQLDMTAQDLFTLSRTVFKQLVQDNWEWKGQFETMKTMYNKTVSRIG